MRQKSWWSKVIFKQALLQSPPPPHTHTVGFSPASVIEWGNRLKKWKHSNTDENTATLIQLL